MIESGARPSPEVSVCEHERTNCERVTCLFIMKEKVTGCTVHDCQGVIDRRKDIGPFR